MMTQDQVESVAKQRLETFKFRAQSSIPTSSSMDSLSPSYRRPHSRNGSVSSMPFSMSSNSVSSTTTDSTPLASPSDSRPLSTSSGRSRPSSHHRRRSSVSTRVESAEIMRINLTDLPASNSDDNINFGDKDSVRRRALLTLEGRCDLGESSSTVQIPDFDKLEHPKPRTRPDPIPKPQLTISSGTYASSSSLSGKRDSFGKLLTPSSSLKDQLQTLIEEEEEEEHDAPVQPRSHTLLSNRRSVVIASGDFSSIEQRKTPTNSLLLNNVVNTSQSISPPRPKPANLALRPLALAPSPSSTGLLTPSISPNPRPNGLKVLTLNASDANPPGTLLQLPPHKSGEVKPGTVPSPPRAGKADRVISQERLGNIPYVRSAAVSKPAFPFGNSALPTPGSTPTSERRMSSSSTATSESENLPNKDRRSLSDEIFLHQSHVALLARIADLERALQARSFQSFQQKQLVPSDEVLALVADLRLERDDLKQDVTNYRARVKDLEDDKGRLEKAIATEKGNVKAKEEKAARLESEKSTLLRQLKEKQEEMRVLSSKLADLQTQLTETERTRDESLSETCRLQQQLERADAALKEKQTLEEELLSARAALLQEQARRQQLERQISAGQAQSSGRSAGSGIARGLGFQSVDSTRTRVGSVDNQNLVKGPFTLKPVEEEEDENEHEYSDEENGLAGYEDEEDSDLSFTCPSRSMSSSSLDEDLPRSVQHLQVAAQTLSSSPSPSPSPCLTPVSHPTALPEPTHTVSHERQSSLSKNWKFPASDHTPTPRREEIDHFFGCIDDLDGSPELSSVRVFSDKNAFSEALRQADEQDCFALPPINVQGQRGDRRSFLEAVIEEEEDYEDDDMQSVELGAAFRGSLGFNRARSSFPMSVSDDSLSLSSHGHSQEGISSGNSSFSAVTPFSSSYGLSSPIMRMELPHSPLVASPSTQHFGTPRSNSHFSGVTSSSKEREPISPPSRGMTPREPCIPQLASRSSPMLPIKLSSPPPARTTPRTSPRQVLSPGVTFFAAPPARTSPKVPEPPKKSPLRTYSNGSSLIPQFKSLSTRSFLPFDDSAETDISLYRLPVSKSEMSASSSQLNYQVKPELSKSSTHSVSSHEATNSTTLSMRLSLSSLTKLIPVSGFSWTHEGGDRPFTSHSHRETQSHTRVYIRREVQLAKLKQTLDIERDSKIPNFIMDTAHCPECRGGLISL